MSAKCFAVLWVLSIAIGGMVLCRGWAGFATLSCMFVVVMVDELVGAINKRGEPQKQRSEDY